MENKEISAEEKERQEEKNMLQTLIKQFHTHSSKEYELKLDMAHVIVDTKYYGQVINYLYERLIKLT